MTGARIQDMEDQTAQTIKEFVYQRFPQARKRAIGEGDSLLESGIVDSLGILEIVGFLEKTYAITIADDDLVSENFETVTALSAFVARKR